MRERLRPRRSPDTTIDLVVDQEKATDFFVDDIDRAQAAGSLASYTTAAGYAMAEDTDKFLANPLSRRAPAEWLGSGPLAIRRSTSSATRARC